LVFPKVWERGGFWKNQNSITSQLAILPNGG